MARVLKPVRFRYEAALVEQGLTLIAGGDEAGRGPLAGPVFAAAVVLPTDWILGGIPKSLKKLNDSKQLTPEQREMFYAELISRHDVRHSIAQVPEQMIDQINILQATHRAMNQALAGLNPAPQHVLVDGLRVKTLAWPQTPIVSGDALIWLFCSPC